MNQYIVGTQMSLKVTFTDSVGTLVNPTAVTGEIILPDQTTEEFETITNPSTGIFVQLFTPTQNGLHQYRFAGTGAVIAAQEGNFLAQTSFPVDS